LTLRDAPPTFLCFHITPKAPFMTESQPDLTRLRIQRDDPAPTAAGSGRVLWIVIGLVVVGAIAAAALLRPRTLEVRVATASATGGGDLSPAGISANGYVVARTKASVSAKIPGRLDYLGVHEGSNVRKGQVIARIESADYDAALNSARAGVGEVDASLLQARRDLERARRLKQEQVISATEVESAETRVRVLEAQLQSAHARRRIAEVNLENTRVRAPFDGTVLRKDAEVGEIVAPASAGGGLTRTAIVTMADLSTLEVEVDVNEAYIAQIANGQAARITLDAYTDTSFAGRVRQVVPTADRQKATVQVKVSILDRDPRILPEMGAKVVFVRDGGQEVAVAGPRRVNVPAAAVVERADGSRVWVVENGRAVPRAVRVGPAQGERVEIREGLAGGESVILSPPASLEQGARVRVAGS
jgi:RND family efflux transporter MFP subunit